MANNNRPLSLLPAISKICERVALNQLTSYMNEKNCPSKHQSGNKKLHSCETLGVFMTNKVFKAMDSKELSLRIHKVNVTLGQLSKMLGYGGMLYRQLSKMLGYGGEDIKIRKSSESPYVSDLHGITSIYVYCNICSTANRRKHERSFAKNHCC